MVIIDIKIKDKMKTITKIITGCLLAILMLSSCSIQKRQYTGGYYVEWHKKNIGGIETKTTSGNDEMISRTVMLAKEKPNDELSIQADNIITADVGANNIASNKKQYGRPVKKESKNLSHTILRVIKHPFLKNPIEEPKKTHPKAIAALVLGILSLITVYGALVMAILAIIFGVKAKKEILASPDKYTGLGMAKAGLICGIIGCAIFALVILLLL